MEIKKWKEWVEGLRSGEKLPGKNHLLIIFLAGLLLLIIIIPVPGTSENEENADYTEEEAEGFADLENYELYLEQKTAQTLRQVEGVGNVSVMITLKSGGQKIVEKDQTGSVQTTEETDSTGGKRRISDQTSEKSSIYTQESDGSSVPYISKELSPEIEGVVIIAQGGDDAVVVQHITEAVQALFGVEAHKIKIMKRASYIEEGGVEN